MTDRKSLTEGKIWQKILVFFFPLMLGSIFQILYNMVDTIVVGQFVGTTGISAVGGAAATIINLFVSFFVGISTGATVVISHEFGAGSQEGVKKAIRTTAALALAIGAGLTVLGIASAREVLILMKTPEDTLRESVTYLRIYSAGMIPNVFYNMSSGILRGIGDSRRPTIYLVISTGVNIVLDLLLVAVIPLGVGGAALATIIAQAISALLCLRTLVKTEEPWRLVLSEIRFEQGYPSRILEIGIPAGITSMMYAISNIIIQASINSFGTATVAACAVVSKVDSLYWMIIGALQSAITTFSGQNFGAGKMERIRKGTWQSFGIAILITVMLCAVLLTFMPELLRLFTSDGEVISIGLRVCLWLVPFYALFLPEIVLNSVLQGMGDAIIPTIITVLSVCVTRIIWCVTVVPHWPKIEVVMECYPVTWGFTSVLFVFYFLWFTRKKGYFRRKAVRAAK